MTVNLAMASYAFEKIGRFSADITLRPALSRRFLKVPIAPAANRFGNEDAAGRKVFGERSVCSAVQEFRISRLEREGNVRADGSTLLQGKCKKRLARPTMLIQGCYTQDAGCV